MTMTMTSAEAILLYVSNANLPGDVAADDDGLTIRKHPRELLEAGGSASHSFLRRAKSPPSSNAQGSMDSIEASSIAISHVVSRN
jgi:hypothetical protein